MKVTLEELQNLRSTLVSHRLEHEQLVTQTQVLRARSRELRTQISSVVQAPSKQRKTLLLGARTTA